jgi:hypothetical protein
MRLGMNSLKKAGSAAGKEIQGLSVFPILMQKWLAAHQRTPYLNFHFSINTERF